MEPIVSVIMLTYNREGLVSRAIESVLAQTFTDFEFIIVDNGSTDNSGKIADEYAAKDGRIYVIHRDRGSIGSGRNTGLDAAKGDYIAFVDDDDWCDSDFLEFIYNLAVNNGADISICGAYHRAYNERYIMTPEQAIIALQWRKLYSVAFPTKLIKREIFDIRFSETAKYDDIELMALILAKANKIAYDGTPKYTFERELVNHNSAWTRNAVLMKLNDLEEYLQVYRNRADWLCNIFPNNKELWRYFYWSFMISMIERIHRLSLVECYGIAEIMKLELVTHKATFLACKEIQHYEKAWMERYV